ncbi:GNAT family N-acetyltransferase [Candidatus Woesearchaeota archaeon]|nr:GNAT family N-acetyltransferase [Candidatus Woesearchaeota archaeon]
MQLENSIESSAVLRGERTLLIEPSMNHLDELYDLLRDPDVLLPNHGLPYPCSKDELGYELQKFKKQEESGESIGFCIYETSLEHVIGTIGFNEIDSENNTAAIGSWLGKQYWRKGYATESLRLMLDLGFTHLQLEQIYAKVLSTNVASMRLLERLGFQKEGVFRRQVFRDCTFHDILVYGLLKCEYSQVFL